MLTFLEALIGLGLVALLISFLPTLYSAYSDREKGVGLMSPLFGTDPSPIELILRTHNFRAMSSPSIWGPVSSWFASLEQSHTAFPSLSSFPPQVPERSWVVAAGTILDAASLLVAVLPADDADRSPEYTLVLAHGSSALSRVALAAGLPVELSRPPTDAIRRHDVDRARSGSPATSSMPRWRRSAWPDLGVRRDVDEGWRTFTLLRQTYEDALLGSLRPDPRPVGRMELGPPVLGGPSALLRPAALERRQAVAAVLGRLTGWSAATGTRSIGARTPT